MNDSNFKPSENQMHMQESQIDFFYQKALDLLNYLLSSSTYLLSIYRDPQGRDIVAARIDH